MNFNNINKSQLRDISKPSSFSMSGVSSSFTTEQAKETLVCFNYLKGDMNLQAVPQETSRQLTERVIFHSLSF